VADISAARTALANQIQSLTGLPCTPRMPDQINPPQAALLPSQPYAKYGITLGGHLASLGRPVPVVTELNMAVCVFVSRAGSVERAQQQVDQYLGFEPSSGVVSIPMAIDEDPTLGGVVEFCEPLTVQAYGDIEIAGQTYFQGRLLVALSVHQDLSLCTCTTHARYGSALNAVCGGKSATCHARLCTTARGAAITATPKFPLLRKADGLGQRG